MQMKQISDKVNLDIRQGKETEEDFCEFDIRPNNGMGGSRGWGTGGPDPPEKSQKYRVS